MPIARCNCNSQLMWSSRPHGTEENRVCFRLELSIEVHAQTAQVKLCSVLKYCYNILTSVLLKVQRCNICHLPLFADCWARLCSECCSDQNVSILFSLASSAKVSYRRYSHS